MQSIPHLEDEGKQEALTVCLCQHPPLATHPLLCTSCVFCVVQALKSVGVCDDVAYTHALYGDGITTTDITQSEPEPDVFAVTLPTCLLAAHHLCACECACVAATVAVRLCVCVLVCAHVQALMSLHCKDCIASSMVWQFAMV